MELVTGYRSDTRVSQEPKPTQTNGVPGGEQYPFGDMGYLHPESRSLNVVIMGL
jgi:hypothetical protein